MLYLHFDCYSGRHPPAPSNGYFAPNHAALALNNAVLAPDNIHLAPRRRSFRTPMDPRQIVLENPFKYCHVYRCAVDKLSSLLRKTTDIEVQRELFQSFARKFTLSPELLRKWKMLETQGIPLWDTEKLEERETFINVIASDHLIDDKILNFSFAKPNQFPVLNKVLTSYQFDENNLEHDADNFVDLMKNIKAALTFPNPHLKQFYQYYEKHSLNKITDDLEAKHSQALIWSNQFQYFNPNSQKWIDQLKRTKDHEFIVQNIEARIGMCPFNKIMWRGYIEYLAGFDPKFLLTVYSRYCHFFVDEWEMRENYRRQIKRLQRRGENVAHWLADYKMLKVDFPLVVPPKYVLRWLFDDLIDVISETFGTHLALLKPEPPYLFRHLKDFGDFGDPISDPEIFVEFKRPCFQFPMFEYIAKNASKKVITKLCSISKWFGYRILLCHRLSLTDSPRTRVTEAAILFSPQHLNYPQLKNIFVTNSLIIASNNDSFALPKLMPKLHRCDPCFIEIKNQMITFKDYCFITAGGNVADISFDSVCVVDENGDDVPVDYLIERLPKARSMKFGPGTVINYDTSTRLGDFHSKTVIKNFELHGLDESFDVYGFSQFIRGNTTPYTNLSLVYKDDIEVAVKSEFRCRLFLITESWNWMPRFQIYNLKIQ